MWEYFLASFDILDFVFILLGAGTAYKLAGAKDGEL
jgi:hypothetical protein